MPRLTAGSLAWERSAMTYSTEQSQVPDMPTRHHPERPPSSEVRRYNPIVEWVLENQGLRIFVDAVIGKRGPFQKALLWTVHFVEAVADKVQSRESNRPDLEKRFGDGDRDIVEEGSWQSFPASDPPSTSPPQAT